MKDFKVTRKLMGSIFELIIADDDQAKAEFYIEAGIKEIQRLEELLTEFADSSETSLVNINAGIAPVRVSEETYMLVKRCVQLSELTQGAFDITTGPLKHLYHFKNGNSPFPAPSFIQAALSYTGYKNIVFGENTLFLPKKNMKIGFSAIGKGYAADCVKRLWLEAGIKNAVVNASGDLTVIGNNAHGEPWVIGIADPDRPDKILLHLPLKSGSIATSGNYEQFFMRNGIRYGHTIDPKTGLPVTGVKSVTVLGPGAELCDALATAVYVMGVEAGMHLINQLPETHCLIIDDRNQLHKSANVNFKYAEG